MKRTIQRVSSISLVLFCLAGLVSSVQPVTQVRAQETQPQESAVLQDICTSDLLIMPLGDSITKGSSSEVLEETKMISYRKDLWDSLQAAGYNVDFVGSQTNGQFYAGFDANHEGHPGWGANDIRDNVYSYLFALGDEPARVVLLHIGTNDLNSGQPPQEVVDEVGQILDNIDLYEKNTGNTVTVLLARIILHVDGNNPWIEFNNKLQQMAEARIAQGDDLIVVNQESGAGLIYKRSTDGGDMYDNGKNTLHPYHTGFTKMAVVWKQAIESLYQDCNQAPQVTNPGNQSSPEGARVSLKIQATDSDTLTYSAQNLPPDLSIAQSTGVISGQISLNAAQGSPYQVIVTVTDNGKPSRSSQVSFSWTVLPRQEVFLPLALFRKK